MTKPGGAGVWRKKHAARRQKPAKTLMCGIVGIVGRQEVAPLLSTGCGGSNIAAMIPRASRRWSTARSSAAAPRASSIDLEARLAREPVQGRIGIGHTRWATHGVPIERNAHPIASDRVAVVHNGIIENFQALKDELTAHGHRFETQTDTEAVVRLVTHYLREGLSAARGGGQRRCAARRRLRAASCCSPAATIC